MSEFLIAFLPAFVATVAGVVLGLPVALYVNYRLTKFQQQHMALVEVRRRGDIASVIRKSLIYNEVILGKISDLCFEEKVMLDPDLQLSTWSAVGHTFCELCEDPELLQLLSHHWLRLNNLDMLNKKMFAYSVGGLTEINGEDLRSSMWANFLELSRSLQCHSKILEVRLGKYNVN